LDGLVFLGIGWFFYRLDWFSKVWILWVFYGIGSGFNRVG